VVILLAVGLGMTDCRTAKAKARARTRTKSAAVFLRVFPFYHPVLFFNDSSLIEIHGQLGAVHNKDINL
jgi:hypothetical protein